MNRISYNPSWFLDPDRNPLLHRLVRSVFYNHFCAGEYDEEVKGTIKDMKKMGFDGVILGCAKETLAHKSVNPKTAEQPCSSKEIVEQWKRVSLETLTMLSPEDFLAIK
jgi:proline dehydrogenase